MLHYLPELWGMPANLVTHLGPSGGQARFLSMIRSSMQEACLVVLWHFCLQTQMETRHKTTFYSNSSDTPKVWVVFGTKMVGGKWERGGGLAQTIFPCSHLGLGYVVCFLFFLSPLSCTPNKYNRI